MNNPTDETFVCNICGKTYSIDELSENSEYVEGESDLLYCIHCVVDDYDDSMDGDHDSAMASTGWGTDEDYGIYDEDFGDYGHDDEDYYD